MISSQDYEHWFGIFSFDCSYKARVVAPSHPAASFAPFLQHLGVSVPNVHVSISRGLSGWHGIMFRSHLPLQCQCDFVFLLGQSHCSVTVTSLGTWKYPASIQTEVTGVDRARFFFSSYPSAQRVPPLNEHVFHLRDDGRLYHYCD